MFRPLTSLATLTVLAGLAAQEPLPDQPVVAHRQSTGFVLEAGAHDLQDVIEKAATYLGRNILMNPAEFQHGSELRLHKRIEVDAPGCWELLNGFLYHKGYAILPLDPERGFYEVISMNGPRRSELTTNATLVPADEIAKYAKWKATPVMTAVNLEHINATVATNSLRPLFMTQAQPSLTIGNVGNERAVILLGLAPQVAAACDLLRRTDVPPAPVDAELRVIALRHAAAADVAETVREITGLAGGRGQYAGQGMPAPSPTYDLVAQAATNSIVLRGSPAEIQRMQDLIAALDVEPPAKLPASTDLLERLQALEQRVRALEKAAGR